MAIVWPVLEMAIRSLAAGTVGYTNLIVEEVPRVSGRRLPSLLPEALGPAARFATAACLRPAAVPSGPSDAQARATSSVRPGVLRPAEVRPTSALPGTSDA